MLNKSLPSQEESKAKSWWQFWNDKPFAVSVRSYLMDPGQPWRQDGAEKIKLKHRDEICTLNPILDELVREGRIKMTVEKQGDIVSLISG